MTPVMDRVVRSESKEHTLLVEFYRVALEHSDDDSYETENMI